MNIARPISVVHLDDDPELLRVTKRSVELAQPDLTVRPTTNAEAALGMLPAVDCIITDYVMHGIDGLQFLEAVRGVDLDLPVIFFTGRGSEDVAAEAFELGVTDYLHKSIGGQQYALLGNRVVNLVERHRAAQVAAQATSQVNRIYDRIGEAYISVGPDWTVRYLNSAAEALLVTGEEFEPGRCFWELFTDADAESRRDLEAAMQGRSPTTFDTYVLDLDRWLEVRAYPSPEGLSVYVRDVTGEIDLGGVREHTTRRPNSDEAHSPRNV
jgi:CheY-like chemotaxis protein